MNFIEFKEKYEKVPVFEYPNNVPENVTISVCVQTYQHVGFISQCLDSIIAQKTNFDFEILLGEDYSSDGTRDICIDYAKRYPNIIRLFLHHRTNNIKINNKATGRFNMLNNIFNSKGKYIAICEGDDYWTDSNKLQIQYDFLENHPNYNIVGHNIETLIESGKLIKARYFSYKDGRYYLYRNFTPTLSLLFRRTNKTGDLPVYMEKTSMADMPLCYHVADSQKVKKIKKIMGVRRVHGGGVWSQLDRLQICDNGIEAREEMRAHINAGDEYFLNAGINRLKVKKFLFQKTDGLDPTPPQLLKDSKYLNIHKAVLSISTLIKSKRGLNYLNKACDYITDISINLLKD